MPTRKTAAQRRRAKAICSKASPAISTRIEGTLGQSQDGSMVELPGANRVHVSQTIRETLSAQQDEEPRSDCDEHSCAKASEPLLKKSGSQDSIQTEFSTDEGSSSCGSNSTPMLGEASVAGDAMQKDFRVAHPGSAQTCQQSLPPPLWVDNGLKGEATAWLLVRPKFQDQIDQFGRRGVPLPKSPEDTMLLGPYVSTKNTFLEEGRVEDRCNRRLAYRSRAQSIGACKFGIS